MTGPQPTGSDATVPTEAYDETHPDHNDWVAKTGRCMADHDHERSTASAGDVERLLAAHAAHVGWSGRHWNADCLATDCDWSGYGEDGGPAGMAAAWAAHRGHVASVIATLLADVRREERERGAREALRDVAATVAAIRDENPPATPTKVARAYLSGWLQALAEVFVVLDGVREARGGAR